jgi:eukaryotic-like serine/threonine-protein kinase
MTFDSNPQLEVELSEWRTPRSRRESSRGRREQTVRFLGQIIGDRYRIERLIARGAMGHVYAATQLDMDRPVAIKILSLRDEAANDRYRRRFHREASIASRLSHPNIVTVYDYGETRARDLFMVMERIPGRNLRMLLEEEKRLFPRRALSIAIQIARALRKAHREGVMHRDLKPDNVMVQPDEDGLDFVKVLDFGLVKVFDPEISGVDFQPEITRADAILGTPAYMSPEQAAGSAVDGRTDLYALGVMLFQMIAGHPPFQAANPIVLINMHVLKPAPRLTELVPSCPIAIAEIVDRCLRKTAAERHASVDELLAELEEK